MDEQFQQLVLEIQQVGQAPAARQQAIAEFATLILKSRQIARSYQGRSPSGLYQTLYEVAHRHLQQEIEQTIDDYNPARIPVQEWVQKVRQDTYRTVLDRTCLQQLALEVQQQQINSPLYQYAIQELVQALHLSNKLLRLSKLPPDTYQDAVNETLLWVCANIHKYDATRGDFLDWVNFRLDKTAQKVQQSQKDPYVQGLQGSIIRVRYQLSGLAKHIAIPDLCSWLQLYLKGLIPEAIVNLNVLFSLSLMILIQHYPIVLHEMAQASFSEFPQLVQMDDATALEAIPQMEEPFSLFERLQQYFVDDPKGLLHQKKMRDRPEVTFQLIGLERLRGTAWKELSATYGVKIAALSNFYQRALKELESEIRSAIQDEF